jgi:glucosylceramidase
MKGFIYSIYGLIVLLISACSQTGYHEVHIYQTSKAGDKLKKSELSILNKNQNSGLAQVDVQPDKVFQTIEGFGGAFTESSAWVLNQITPGKRQEVIDAYFTPAGADYSLMRTHINSCDFSLGHYSYAAVAGDTLLENFTISEDMNDLVPLIKDAQQASKNGFKLLASPWTAPPWMKDNGEWNAGSLKPELYSTWALFFSKYIRAYAEQGINIWGITVENEPENNSGNWDSMLFTPLQMASFIKNNLGPQLKKDNAAVKIMIFDHNRDRVEEWANSILGDSAAAAFVWGTAVHWYSSTTEWYPETLNKVHASYPDYPLMHTEGCIDTEIPVWQDDTWYWSKEATDWGYTWAPEKDKPLHPPYVPVYRYARDIIGGLNSWLAGWIDWNIVLDDKGGPNHARNWCIAPVIVKPETDEAYYTPLFYVMSHFSKYIRPGAVRIGVTNPLPGLMITSCRNTDGSLAVVVLNQGEEKSIFELRVGSQSVVVEIPANALQTIIFS